MIQLIAMAIVTLAAGALIGGCTRDDGRLTQPLLDRNAQLQNQVGAGHDALTALASVLMITGCALAVALYHIFRGAHGRKAP